MLATCTDVAPLAALAVRLVVPATFSHRSPMRKRGLATVLVFRSLVRPGPIPRTVMLLEMKMGWLPLIRKSPAESWTTWPVGQALIADWIPLVASIVPLP